MFFNTNQVTLLGYISSGHIKKFYSSSNQLSVVFELRTADTWLSRDGEVKKHYDFHNIIIRDIGKRDVATRYMSLIVPGNKVLIQGRLRSHVSSENSWTDRVCEVDANCVELVSSFMASDKNKEAENKAQKSTEDKSKADVICSKTQEQDITLTEAGAVFNDSSLQTGLIDTGEIQ